MTKQTIYYATGNKNKIKEARYHFKDLKQYKIEQYQVSRVEPQEEDPVAVATFSANYILKNDPNVKKPFFVEDAGLFIDVLKGFPGVYSSYALKTLGNEGILTLIKGKQNRSARFRSTIALITKQNQVLVFKGKTEGRISKEIRGKAWGFNPIFIPNGSNNRSYAELGTEKDKFSHRIRSVKQMLTYFKEKESDQNG